MNNKALEKYQPYVVQAITYGGVISEVYNTCKNWYQRYKAIQRSKLFQIMIPYDDWFARHVFAWALDKANFEANRLTSITTDRYNWDRDEEVYEVFFVPDVNITFTFLIDGYEITAHLGEEDTENTVINGNYIAPKKQIFFTTKTKAGLYALKHELAEFHAKKGKEISRSGENRFNFKVYTKSGSWNHSRREERPLSSVILKSGQIEDITNDLDRFFNSRTKYLNKGIPWRRGYLLYGPPGNGKSSIVKGLANHFNMDIYYISMSDIISDSDLILAIGRIEGKGLLLIEDIDIFSNARVREENQKEDGVTLSGLLNALDGTAAPDGLVTFLTTNNREYLDKALTRKGRIDYSLEVGMPDLQQIKDLWSLFYETKCPIDSINEDLPISHYFDIFKRNLEDPNGAEAELLDTWLITK